MQRSLEKAFKFDLSSLQQMGGNLRLAILFRLECKLIISVIAYLNCQMLLDEYKVSES